MARGAPPPAPGAGPLTRAIRLARRVLMVCGLAFLALLGLAFTELPSRAYRALGTDPRPLKGAPDYIVLLGGGGIPSESGLMRTYHAAAWAERYPAARVVVAMPGRPDRPTSTVARMKRELELRGVAAKRLLFETEGLHTWQQAVNVHKLIKPAAKPPVLLVVTSPEHVRRSLRAFRKAGFTQVHGDAAHEARLEVDLELPGGPAGDTELRYDVWNRLVYEVRILREAIALAYYTLRGWN